MPSPRSRAHPSRQAFEWPSSPNIHIAESGWDAAPMQIPPAGSGRNLVAPLSTPAGAGPGQRQSVRSAAAPDPANDRRHTFPFNVVAANNFASTGTSGDCNSSCVVVQASIYTSVSRAAQVEQKASKKYRFLELLEKFMGLSLFRSLHIALHCCDGRQDRGKCLTGAFLAGHCGIDSDFKSASANRQQRKTHRWSGEEDLDVEGKGSAGQSGMGRISGIVITERSRDSSSKALRLLRLRKKSLLY